MNELDPEPAAENSVLLWEPQGLSFKSQFKNQSPHTLVITHLSLCSLPPRPLHFSPLCLEHSFKPQLFCDCLPLLPQIFTPCHFFSGAFPNSLILSLTSPFPFLFFSITFITI